MEGIAAESTGVSEGDCRIEQRQIVHRLRWTEPRADDFCLTAENVAIPADSFARAVAFAISQPDDVDINEILFRPTRQEL